MSLFEKKTDFKGEHLASWNFIYGDVVFRAMHLVNTLTGLA